MFSRFAWGGLEKKKDAPNDEGILLLRRRRKRADMVFEHDLKKSNYRGKNPNSGSQAGGVENSQGGLWLGGVEESGEADGEIIR